MHGEVRIVVKLQGVRRISTSSERLVAENLLRSSFTPPPATSFQRGRSYPCYGLFGAGGAHTPFPGVAAAPAAHRAPRGGSPHDGCGPDKSLYPGSVNQIVKLRLSASSRPSMHTAATAATRRSVPGTGPACAIGVHLAGVETCGAVDEGR